MNYRILHFSYIVIFLLLVCRPLFAQNAKYRVLLRTVLPGAFVRSKCFSGGNRNRCCYRFIRDFLILNVPPGQYQLKIIYIGYSDYPLL